MRYFAWVLLIAGCGPGSGSSSPAVPYVEIGPIIVNTPDTFTVVPMGFVSDGARSYSWSCSQDQANLVVGGISGGSIRIEVRDAAGSLVHDNTYDGGLMGAVDTVTRPGGAPGTWEVRLTFAGVLAVNTIVLSADTLGTADSVTIAGAYSLDATFHYDVGWGAGSAQVAIASAISLGTVRVRMWDGLGVLVLDKTNIAIFVGAMNGDSHAGAAGTWHIRLDVDATATAGAISLSHP